MKNNSQIVFKSMILLLMAMFTFSLANAQEEKQEKKEMKIKIVSDEEGKIKFDTTITLDEDFDGDWSSIIEDEELLEKLEELDIDLDIEGEENIYVVKAPQTQTKSYFYTVETDDDGEVSVDVEVESDGDELHKVFVKEFEGDSTISIVLKTGDCKVEAAHQEVMVWKSDDEGEEKEYKIYFTQPHKINVHKLDGDSLVTYKVMVDDDGEKNVSVWYGQEAEAVGSDVLIKKMHGDSCKVIIRTTGDEEELKVVKKKEVIIITEDVDKKGKAKDKEKKKKKKKK